MIKNTLGSLFCFLILNLFQIQNASACGFHSSVGGEAVVKTQLTCSAPTRQTHDFSFEVLNWNGAAVNVRANSVRVELYMPSMGHGSRPTQVVSVGASSFNVSNVYFLMGGFWEVRIAYTLENGSEQLARIAVEIE